MDNLFVRPRLIDGQPAVLPDPQSGVPLAADGEWKPRTAFWLRRVAQKDVIEGKPVAAAPASPPPSPMPSAQSKPAAAKEAPARSVKS
jgi:hypothetical protein